MVKLYYSTNSAGAAAFLAAHYGSVPMETEQVDMRTHRTVTNNYNYFHINPKGTVPCIVLDDRAGTVLNDIISVMVYIGSKGQRVMAPQDTPDYFTTIGQLSFISTELHASYGHLLNPSLPEETKTFMREKLLSKLAYLNIDPLSDGRHFMVGDTFSVVDAYLFIVLSWSAHVQVSTEGFKYITQYYNRLAGHPFIEEAFDIMGHNPTGTLRHL